MTFRGDITRDQGWVSSSRDMGTGLEFQRLFLESTERTTRIWAVGISNPRGGVLEERQDKAEPRKDQGPGTTDKRGEFRFEARQARPADGLSPMWVEVGWHGLESGQGGVEDGLLEHSVTQEVIIGTAKVLSRAPTAKSDGD